MMQDIQVNYYEVVAEADRYFETHDKGKGSGWKPYQRWKHENEGRYYPDGNRNLTKPSYVTDAYQNILKNSQTSNRELPGEWKDLGPYDANNITTHYNPGIGRVECFWVNPNDPSQIYMGSRSGGLWKTIDEGLTWYNTTDYLVASGVNTIAADPLNPNDVFINVQNAANNTTHGIYRSIDGGDTWTETGFNPVELGWGGLGSNAKIYAIVFHPTIPDLILVGTSRGLFLSTDKMQTWSLVFSNSSVIDIEFHPTNQDIIYAYDVNRSNNVIYSLDRGLTWSTSNTISGNDGSRGHIAVSPQCEDCVWFASSNGVWKSTDKGLNFSFLYNPDESCRGFAVSDTDPNSILYGYVELEMSLDGGNSFNQVTSWANSNPDHTYVHADLRTAECIDGVYYVGTDGYLCKSHDNGASWERLSDGTGIREFYKMGISQSNPNVHMAGSQDNGTSILDETGWIEWNGGDGMEAVIQPLNDDWMIGSWQYGSRQRTLDGGQSRHGVNTPQEGYWVAPMLLNPNHQMMVHHFATDVYTSDHFGNDWDLIGSPGIGDIKAAAIAQNNSGIMLVSRNEAIHLSVDTGATYTPVSDGLPSHAVRDIAFDPNDDSTIIVTFNRYQNDGNKVYISHDLGSTWTNITANLGDMPIRAVIIDHSPESNIYLGAEIGVYFKPMDSTTWELYNPGLPNVAINELEIQYGSNMLRAATWGRGLWEYPLAGRHDYPSIIATSITETPSFNTPKELTPQFVTSVISYEDSLSSVFVRWSTGNPTLDSVIEMINTTDSTWVSLESIPIFPDGTNVYFKVFAVGTNNDTTETYKFHYVPHEAAYCDSYGNMEWQTAVTLVDIGHINNASQKTQPYTDYSSTDSTVLNTWRNYDLTVNLNTDGDYTIYSTVWIDWNKDLDFDDDGEMYDLGSARNTTDGPTTLSPFAIAVPEDAVIGKTKMRVSAKYNSQPNNCETGFDGEVEEYAIIINDCTIAIHEIAEESCSPYTSPSGNHSYNTSGIYYDTLYFQNGCDSILIIDLTIKEVNTDILLDSTTLVSQAQDATYQWIDCDNGNSVFQDETEQSFTPEVSGNYAVIINQNDCVDTTTCLNVVILDVTESHFENNIILYPNPTKNLFSIDFGSIQPIIQVELIDSYGKIVSEKKVFNKAEIIIDHNLAKGIYLVNISNGKRNALKKLLVLSSKD